MSSALMQSSHSPGPWGKPTQTCAIPSPFPYKFQLLHLNSSVCFYTSQSSELCAPCAAVWVCPWAESQAKSGLISSISLFSRITTFCFLLSNAWKHVLYILSAGKLGLVPVTLSRLETEAWILDEVAKFSELYTIFTIFCMVLWSHLLKMIAF